MKTETESSAKPLKQARNIQLLLLGLVLTNVGGFGVIAWMLDSQLTRLRHDVGVLRAVNNEQFIVDQREFSPGQARWTIGLDQFDSVDDFLSWYESGPLKIHVRKGSYGQKWWLVDHNHHPFPFSNDTVKNLRMRDAGVKPGTALRVVRKVGT